MNNTLNSVTNELLKQYDMKFNKNYNSIVQVNSSIQNKEELIYKIQSELLYKDRNIIILQYSIYYIIVWAILFLLYVNGTMVYNQFLSVTIFLFFVFGIACYFHLINYFKMSTIESRVKGLGVIMKEYYDKERDNIIPPYTCPSTCQTIPEEMDEETVIDYKYDKSGVVLNIDPSLNVWKDGDVPVNQDVESLSDLTKIDMPKPFFGTTYPKTTYYKCKWLGGGGARGMPYRMKTTNKFSTIPCEYRPNNTEEARYICTKDPNENGLEDCEKI